MNGYELSKIWYSFCRENSDRVNPNHHALFFWIVEKANNLQWPQNFGLPTDEAMFFLGINSYKTYIKALRELVDFGIIDLLSESKNQYTSNRICFGKKCQSDSKANTKASPKQVQSKSKASPKQSDHNKTIETLKTNETIKHINNISDSDCDFFKDDNLKVGHEKAPQTGAQPNESNFPFEIIWGMYGKKGSAKVSKQRYEKLKENIREIIFEHVPRYVSSTPELKFRKNFEVYLNQETYNDQIIEHGSSSAKTVYRSSKNESSEQYLGRVGSELDEIFERRFGKSSNEASDTASYEFDHYTDFKDV